MSETIVEVQECTTLQDTSCNLDHAVGSAMKAEEREIKAQAASSRASGIRVRDLPIRL